MAPEGGGRPVGVCAEACCRRLNPSRTAGQVEVNTRLPIPLAEPQDGTVAQRRGSKRSELDEARRAVAAFVAAGADESVQRVITAVHSVSRRLDRWYDQQLADHDVTRGEWAVLSALARSEGPLTPTQLARAAHVAPSSMTHRLDRMAARQLVTRDVDPDNRTRILVGLTDEGWRLFASVIRESNLVESDLMAGLTEQQVDELADLLEKVLSGLDSSSLPDQAT